MRLGDIEGLRALAALAILVATAVRFLGPPPGAPAPVAQLLGDASQGLTLFLLLSAFGLAYPLLTAIRGTGAVSLDLGRYVARRAIRVYPAYLAVLVAAAVVHPAAVLLGVTTVANAVPAFDVASLARTAAFLGDGLGNDGFRAVGAVVRGYVAFPLALWLWVRSPRIALVTALAAVAADLLTPAHALGVAGAMPLMLGIAAADARVRGLAFARFGPPLAVGGAAVAFALEPFLWKLGGFAAAPDALRIDPLWAVACFGFVIASGAFPRIARVAGFVPFRLAGGAAFGVTLVAMPLAEYAATHAPPAIGWAGAFGLIGATVYGAGTILALSIDRWPADARIRAGAANVPGAILDRLLRAVRIAELRFGADLAGEPAVGFKSTEPVEPTIEQAAGGWNDPYAAPAPGSLAVLSTRSGSAEDLAAEIQETKRRLTDRHAPAGEPPDETETYARPGFYRRSAKPARASRREPAERSVTPALALPAAPARGAAGSDATPVPDVVLAVAPESGEPVDLEPTQDGAATPAQPRRPIVKLKISRLQIPPALEPPAFEPPAFEPPAPETVPKASPVPEAAAAVAVAEVAVAAVNVAADPPVAADPVAAVLETPVRETAVPVAAAVLVAAGEPAVEEQATEQPAIEQPAIEQRDVSEPPLLVPVIEATPALMPSAEPRTNNGSVRSLKPSILERVLMQKLRAREAAAPETAAPAPSESPAESVAASSGAATASTADTATIAGSVPSPRIRVKFGASNAPTPREIERV